MARIILCCTLLLLRICTTAQNYKYIYYLNKDLVSTNQTDAVFIGKGFHDEDNTRVDFFYMDRAIIFMSVHFVDSTMAVMHGHFKSYYINGKIENEGDYSNGYENGVWTKWDSSGHKKDSLAYEKGLVYVRASYTYDEKGNANSYEYSDSLKDVYHYIIYDSSGIQYDAMYSGKAGTLITYEQGIPSTKPIYTKEKIEAHFEGGDQAYLKYLQNHLNPMTPVEHNAPPGTYKVIIRFKVGIDGRIIDATPETNFGFGMEQEAVRIISNSPRWIPAKLFGLPFPSYRRSPITFVVAVN